MLQNSTIRFIFLFIILIIPNITFGQSNISFLNLTTENGLANLAVRAVVKDKQGFIWIATADGLQRYDGYELQKYQIKNDSNKLNTNIIRALCLDKNGAIWIGTRGGGLSRYQNGKFELFQHNSDVPNSLPDNDVEAIVEDLDGNIWIGTRQGGLCRFRDGKFTRFQHHPKDSTSLSSQTVFALLVDKKGTLWVGTNGGGLNRKNDDDTFTHFWHLPDNQNSISSNNVISLGTDKNGNIWAGTWQKGLNKLKNGKFQHFTSQNSGINNNSVLSILEDSQGVMWFGTWGGGLNKLENNKFTALQHLPYDDESLSSNYIEHLFEDEEGIIWIGTFAGGLTRLIRSPFTIFKAEVKPNTMKTEYISGICKTADSTLWIGTLGGGLYKYQDEKFTNFQHQNLELNSVWAIQEAKNGVWVGTNGGLVKVHQGKIQRYKLPYNPNNPYDIVYSFHQDKAQNILFGTAEGVIYQIENEQFKVIHKPKNGYQSVSCLWKDSKNRLWVGRHENGGLELIENGKFTSFDVTDNPEIIQNNSPRVLLEDSKNRIWVGTENGLFKYAENGKFISYSSNYDLINHNIQGLKEGQNGDLWISTESGLVQFNPDTKSIQHYTTKDGLAGNVFTFGSAFQHKSGELYFGTNQGLTAFQPAKLNKKTTSLNIVLTDFQIFSKSVINNYFEDKIETIKEINIDYKDNVFTFGFASLNFTNPAQNYQYYLEGFEAEYNPPSKRRFATYTNIPHGTYIFRAKKEGSSKELAITIHIKPPFWERTGFKILVILSVICIPLFIYRHRILQVRRRNENLSKIVQERTKELVKEREEAQQKVQKVQEINEELTSLTEELRQNSEELNSTNQQLTITEKKLSKLLRKEKQQLSVLRNTHTSLVDTQGQLVQSEKMASLGVLTAGIAHEINNPVNFIFAGTEALRGNLEDITDLLEKYNELDESPETEHESKLLKIRELKEELEFDDEVIEDTLGLLTDVQTGALRITEIVKGLRTFSRLDEDIFKVTDIHENIESTLVILRNQYKGRIEIVRDYNTEIPDIECYAGKLNQVFMNLFANAIQAIEGEGFIYITTQIYQEDFIQILVRDTGGGIPEELKNRIFEPFFTTKEVGKGTGLGLSISHGIIEKHHGKISVASDSGKGTEFSIILPLKQPLS